MKFSEVLDDAVVGFVASLYLVLPLSGRPAQQYVLAGALVILGIALFGLTWRSTMRWASRPRRSPTWRNCMPSPRSLPLL
jgi:hypothetical protein